MLQRINHTNMSPTTIGYRLDGQVDAVAYETMGREIQKSIEQNGDVNVLVELGEIESAAVRGFVRALKDNGPDLTHISRIAWVTDQPGLKVAGQVASVLPGINVKHFPTMSQTEAWRWAATGEAS